MTIYRHHHAPGVTEADCQGCIAQVVESESATHYVLREVSFERQQQNAKWGEQNHPDGTGQHVVWAFTGPAEWVRQQATNDTDQAAEQGACTWRHILLEEVAEAFAEERPEELRTELVQIAAVATQWIEAIDRRDPPPVCTCRPSMYDGDDGEDHDCPEHGRAAAEV